MHFVAIELLLFITRRDAVDLGHYPDLKQMNGLGFRSIEFAVRDSGAGAHPLGFAGANDGTGADAVFVFERPLENVRDDLHVSMGMPGKSLSRSDAVFIDDAQRAESRHSAFVEIYPTMFRKMATGSVAKIRSQSNPNIALSQLSSQRTSNNAKRDLSDHETDALLSAAGLRWIASHANVWAPTGLSSPRVQREGWIFGVY